MESHRLADTSATRLARAIDPLAAQHPGKTGVHAMQIATDAFAARMLLAQHAQRSIDAQYYIWHADQTGLMLMQALRDAAVRGVRVRLLIDDQNTKGLDDLLADLAATPNLELRLYNPFVQRRGRFVGYLYDFSRLNRRMHNKSFIVDDRVAVVGGRNIGNEYFGAGDEVPFKDLDVIAIGKAQGAVSDQFDLYWNSASAYPSSRVLAPARDPDAAALDARFAAARADPVSTKYLEAVRDTPLVSDLVAQRLALEWVDAVVVRDDPAKTLAPDPGRDMLALAQIFDVTGPPRTSFDLISPYFVPAEKGTQALADLVHRGVRVRVLTNSLGATDVAVVHSGYAKRRCELARAGVQLYEMKPQVQDAETRRHKASTDSSAASLHAKTFALDDQQIFIGSFNFDPRSALLNTELGLVLKSPVLAGRLDETFRDVVPPNAYEVRARSDGACIEWIERTSAGEVRYEDEPHTGALKRAWLEFLTWLPIDWML
jgi:putative cardiolipin synthase